MGRSHQRCDICWHADVLTTGVDRCEHCEREWKRIVVAYNVLLNRFPKLRAYSIATLFERLVKRVLKAPVG